MNKKINKNKPHNNGPGSRHANTLAAPLMQPPPRRPSPTPPPPSQLQQQEQQQQQPQNSPHYIITSRLCVKNVPKDITVPKLKEHFAAKGEVTDVKILKTRDGHSRQMAFVGYKTSDDAAAAQKYFNNTFVYASRITVEFAVKYHDPTLSRPWSKHSEGSSAQQRLKQQQQQQEEGTKKSAGKKGAVIDGNAAEAQALAARLKGRGAAAGQKQGDDAEADPKLAEFLALMAPRRRAKLWSNDEALPLQTLQDLQAKVAAGSSDSEGEDGGADAAGSSSDEEYDDLNVPGTTKSPRALEAGSAGQESEEDDEGNLGGMKDAAVVAEGVSDLDYLRSRMSKWTDDDDDDKEEEEEDGRADDAARRGDQSGVGPSKSSDPSSSKSKASQKAALKAAGTKKGSKADAKGKTGGAGAMEVDGQVGDDDSDGGGLGSGSGGGEGNPEVGEMDGDGHIGGERDGSLPVNAQPQVVHAVSDAGDPLDLIADTGRLFVRNLTYSASEADLAELFGQFGDVSEVHVVLDRETKRSKGIAYVLFLVPADAVSAYQQLDGQIFQGRLLHILPANRPPSSDKSGLVDEGGQEGHGKGAGSSFKTEREQQRKNDAGNRAAWNSLFIRPDTVAESVAAHYGISKSELMDAHAAGDLAVRMALGEAAVIVQTKTALAEEGVDVTKLEAAAAASGKAASKKSVARSDRTLLVKNLPFSASEEELHALFSRCGPVARLVLPPSHALALVEFTEPQDARSAFKALAYKKYQHVPLYLEWAPHDIFSTPPPPQEQQQAKRAAQPAAAAAGAVDGVAGPQPAAAAAQEAGGAQAMEGLPAGGRGGEEEGEGEGDVSSLYVKNLSFATTDMGLRKHFDKVVSSVGGTLHSARVAKRKGPNGELLSAGFGFVEVNSPSVAALVIKQLQGSMLDNHKLSMQLSKRRAPAAPAPAPAQGQAQPQGQGKKGDGATTKLLVRNVAFEATRKDILGLVTPFGHLKSCRLPKKYDGHHRGYAFVEFVTKQEARNALEGVGGVHLYGRRLVVEYAKDDEGLDELRTKTAAKYKGDDAEVQEPAAKRLRKGL